MTDSITTRKTATISLSDSLAMTDSIAVTKSKQVSLSDSLTLSDSVARSKAVSRTLSETLSLSDSIFKYKTTTGPSIFAIIASDPTASAAGISNGDKIDIVFAEPTNRPDPTSSVSGLTKSDLDAMFTFSQSLGADYTGQWLDNSVLQITIVDSTGASASVGSLTVTIKNTTVEIKNSELTSRASVSTSPTLTGTFTSKPGPIIKTLIASGTNSDTAISAGDTVTVEFDRPTNTPYADSNGTVTSANLSNLFTNMNQLGSSLSGKWISPYYIVITINNPSGSSAVVGTYTTQVKAGANLMAEGGTITSTPTSPVLSGRFAQFEEVASVISGGAAVTELPSGSTVGVDLPSSTQGTITIQVRNLTSSEINTSGSIIGFVNNTIVGITPGNGASCSAGCEISFETSREDLLRANIKSISEIRIFHDSDEDSTLETNEAITTTVTPNSPTSIASHANGTIFKITGTVTFNSKFGIGGIASSLSSSGGGGSTLTNAPTIGSASVVSLGDPSKGLGLSTRTITLDSSSTRIINVGEKNIFKFNLYENQGINNILHVELGIGNGDKDSSQDARIIFEKNKPLSIVDPNHVIADAKFIIIPKDAVNFVLQYEIVFAKSIKTSDVDLVAWDLDRNLAKKLYDNALQVNDNIEAYLESSLKIQKISYDVCTENMIRIIVANTAAPNVTIKTKGGLVNATLSAVQPYEEQNKATSVDLYQFEAPIGPKETILTVTATDPKNPQASVSANLEITSCKSESELYTPVPQYAKAKPSEPKIFDLKAKIGSITVKDYVKAANKDSVTISAIIDTALPIIQSELRLVKIGQPESKYETIGMDVTALPITNTTYVVSAKLSERMLQAPGLSYWLSVSNANMTSVSAKKVLAIEQKDISTSVEMDIRKATPQGTAFTPAVYVQNNNKPVYGTVSLIIDNKTVSSSEILLQSGQTKVDFTWIVPKAKSVESHQASAKLTVYGKEQKTETSLFNTYPQYKVTTTQSQNGITSVTDKDGKTVADVGTIYASNTNKNERLYVIASDGTCVIGGSAKCMIKDTIDNPRKFASIEINNQIYRIKYSGPTSVLERLSITSADPITGQWFVGLEPKDSGVIPDAQAASEIPIKLHYRSDARDMITVK
ncbi:MAG: hypothetical protein EB164_07995 [Thaumarchaeota archaeon]|nr:hypothetical protein [Nitrososphaerota archaeon]